MARPGPLSPCASPLPLESSIPPTKPLSLLFLRLEWSLTTPASAPLLQVSAEGLHFFPGLLM